MEFRQGATRWVILTENRAFKIARFRPWWTIRRLLEHKLQGSVGIALTSYARNPLFAGLRYIFMGICVNIQEARLWKNNVRLPLVPTFHCFGGLLNVQMRGQPVTAEELERDHPLKRSLSSMQPELRKDMMKPENFCRLHGAICLADYGSDETILFFSEPTKVLKLSSTRATL